MNLSIIEKNAATSIWGSVGEVDGQPRKVESTKEVEAECLGRVIVY